MGPNETLGKKVAEIDKKRRRKNPRKNELFVEVPGNLYPSSSMPMIVMVVGTALFAKLLMTYDDSKSQERIELKIKNAPPGQGTVRMRTREEWEEIKEVRARTPFESRLAMRE